MLGHGTEWAERPALSVFVARLYRAIHTVDHLACLIHMMVLLLFGVIDKLLGVKLFVV